jgi:hypothetical protein
MEIVQKKHTGKRGGENLPEQLNDSSVSLAMQ